MDRISKYSPEALSVVRIVVGLLFLEHGSAALLGFPHPTSPAPAIMTLIWVQRVLELLGGLLMVIGLFKTCWFHFGGRHGGRLLYDPRAKKLLSHDQWGRCCNSFLFHLFVLIRLRLGSMEPRQQHFSV